MEGKGRADVRRIGSYWVSWRLISSPSVFLFDLDARRVILFLNLCLDWGGSRTYSRGRVGRCEEDSGRVSIRRMTLDRVLCMDKTMEGWRWEDSVVGRGGMDRGRGTNLKRSMVQNEC